MQISIGFNIRRVIKDRQQGIQDHNLNTPLLLPAAGDAFVPQSRRVVVSEEWFGEAPMLVRIPSLL